MEIATFKFLDVWYYGLIRCMSNTCLQTYQDGQLNIVYTHKVHHHLLYVQLDRMNVLQIMSNISRHPLYDRHDGGYIDAKQERVA